MKLQVKFQLAVLRAKHGKISQSELSRQTGITQKQLSALETGKTKGITFETLAKLCQFFSCTPNELLQLEEVAEIDKPPTEEELSLADEIIARGLNRAMNSPQRSASEIWTEFDNVRAKLSNSAADQDKLEHQNGKRSKLFSIPLFLLLHLSVKIKPTRQQKLSLFCNFPRLKNIRDRI